MPKDAVAKFAEELLQLIERSSVSVGDQQLFKHFIHDMVCLDPGRRQGTSALPNHEYMTNIPEASGYKSKINNRLLGGFRLRAFK